MVVVNATGLYMRVVYVGSEPERRLPQGFHGPGAAAGPTTTLAAGAGVVARARRARVKDDAVQCNSWLVLGAKARCYHRCLGRDQGDRDSNVLGGDGVGVFGVGEGADRVVWQAIGHQGALSAAARPACSCCGVYRRRAIKKAGGIVAEYARRACSGAGADARVGSGRTA